MSTARQKLAQKAIGYDLGPGQKDPSTNPFAPNYNPTDRLPIPPVKPKPKPAPPEIGTKTHPFPNRTPPLAKPRPPHAMKPGPRNSDPNYGGQVNS